MKTGRGVREEAGSQGRPRQTSRRAARLRNRQQGVVRPPLNAFMYSGSSHRLLLVGRPLGSQGICAGPLGFPPEEGGSGSAVVEDLDALIVCRRSLHSLKG